MKSVMDSNPTPSYANMRKLANLSEPQFHYLQNGGNNTPLSLGWCEDNMGKLFLVDKVFICRIVGAQKILELNQK